VSRAAAPAKINLALAVGPSRTDGLHELTSVFQRIDITDRITVEQIGVSRESRITVEGYAGDSLVRGALEAVVSATGFEGVLRARLEKHIPVAAGLGGGSADAGVALRLAHSLLGEPLSERALARLAFGLGADVPFFLTTGPQLVEGAGERLTPLELPQDYWVVVALPEAVEKPSTGEIYERFDAADADGGYGDRRAALLEALAGCARASDLASLPGNDLAPFTGSEPLARELGGLGAFRSGVSGAGPAVYGLFLHERHARSAMRRLEGARRAWLTVPVW
jgi:4-diphosphocytidyl-2-C-methyl-D-erythritol kinase